ncbi:MAG: catalase [Thermomicrobiales bacterium]
MSRSSTPGSAAKTRAPKGPASATPSQPAENAKTQDLATDLVDGAGQFLTTNQGLRVSTTDNSLRAGDRGPTLMEDFHFREKITHFDHERMPERVVHARGAGAHGVFQVYESLGHLTRAGFLQDPGVETPVFVRFSTVAGSRGSADTARDVRGFAVRFYTDEGNFDLVGNNIPVFFIQDAIKFPDLIHAVKPEAPDEMPQAATAHDTAWDFFSLVPETTHMVMWVMSDRAIPRSFRMMEGFGVHTFRLVDAEGRGHFVKFHWKPLLGVHGLVWDEAQKLGGKDPDWLRRDLWDAIAAGAFPEWELGLQVIGEEEEHDFSFDILDATKLWPEELVPVQRVGKLTLNRNPDNFFAETEQVAFHLGNIVPGIDFTNDPLLQGRLFSYLDTQLNRFNGANFHQIPINRAVCPVFNNQRDGYMRQDIPVGRATYFPNSVGDNAPAPASEAEGGFVSEPVEVRGRKVRVRSESFADHFTQARLFYASLSAPEKQHLTDALRFELGKVLRPAIRQRMVDNLAMVDGELAQAVAAWIDVDAPQGTAAGEASVRFKKQSIAASPSLSMEQPPSGSIATRKVALLIADGVDEGDVAAVREALTAEGAICETIAQRLGAVTGAGGGAVAVDKGALTVDSVMYDAVVIPGGEASAAALAAMPKVRAFLTEAYGHAKPIAAAGAGVSVLQAAQLPDLSPDAVAPGGSEDMLGVLTTAGPANGDGFMPEVIAAIAQHRFWDRPGQL